MFESIDIFVYSGTGNTYKAAKCIGETAKSVETECIISMIDVHSKPEDYKPSPSRLLGLMAPTIGLIQPMSFFWFILKLPKGSGQKVFLAATGAWTKIGPIFMPGCVGFGLYLAALFLLFKGYSIVGITGFGMPHNWTTLIPPYWKKLENRINEEIHITAGNFALNILSGKRIYKRIIDMVIVLLLFPIPVLFIMFGHLFLAKSMFAGSSCSGCGLCAANCPRKAIKMYGKKQKRPYWTYKCEQCMRCAGYCPKKAVDTNSFLVLAFVLLFSAVPINSIIVDTLNTAFAFSSLPGSAILTFIIYYIVVLLLGAAIYAVFFLLSRIPLVNKVFTYLSFTHYWRKYKHTDVNTEICPRHKI